MNRTIVSGRWTRDCELRYTPQGTPVANGAIAVNDGYGERKKTYFFDVVIWGKQAEAVCNYSKKGSRIEIDGKLTSRSYENNEGRKIKVTELVAQEVIFVDTKGSGGNQGNQNDQGSQQYSGYDDPPPFNDDDLPF